MRCRASRRYQPDHRIRMPVAVTDDQTARLKAKTQHQESILFPGMIRIVNQTSAFVEKDALSLLERDAMFY